MRFFRKLLVFDPRGDPGDMNSNTSPKLPEQFDSNGGIEMCGWVGWDADAGFVVSFRFEVFSTFLEPFSLLERGKGHSQELFSLSRIGIIVALRSCIGFWNTRTLSFFRVRSFVLASERARGHETGDIRLRRSFLIANNQDAGYRLTG